MSLKQKFKSLKDKLRGKFAKKNKKPEPQNSERSKTDSELSVEQVTEKEIFPDGKRKTKSPAQLNSHLRSKASTPAAKKPASKRTRPTNPDYEMIDPSGDSCDASKS